MKVTVSTYVYLLLVILAWGGVTLFVSLLNLFTRWDWLVFQKQELTSKFLQVLVGEKRKLQDMKTGTI